MSIILLVIFLAGGFSGRFGTPCAERRPRVRRVAICRPPGACVRPTGNERRATNIHVPDYALTTRLHTTPRLCIAFLVSTIRRA